MRVAMIMASRSTCQRVPDGVGAVLAREGRIISTGYVGTAPGSPHCQPGTLCDLSKPCRRTIHAEANAILFAARYGVSTEGTDLYTTMSPCFDCAKLIVNSGIKTVYYHRLYRDEYPMQYLVECGIVVICCP